ncbi:hypothetical protein P7E15_09630 [Enterococcus gallinarum]|nr:hypothetical protein [Enterococcus gallinarum]
MSELNHFSASTLAELQKDEEHPYYVYCLVLETTRLFILGKEKEIVFLPIAKQHLGC